MSGFRYLTGAGGNSDSTDRLRSFLSLGAGNNRQAYGNKFVVAAGFTGTVSITGIGFQPEMVYMFGVGINTTFQDFGLLHSGIGTASDQWATGVSLDYLNGSGSRLRWSSYATDKIIYAVEIDGTLGMDATLDSLDADGFTLTFGTGPLQDSRIAFMCAREGGNYACGSGQVPAAIGTQAITGLGFQPTAVFMACNQMDTLGTDAQWARPTYGAADYQNGQWNVYAGSKSGDLYLSEIAQSGSVLSLWEDVDALGPFDPVLLAAANVSSFDADGFTLDWTTVDTNTYYYSWFAADQYAEANRWLYNHGPLETGRVHTRRKPKGIIFFMNDNGNDGILYGSDTSGAGVALGMYGSPGADGQAHAAYNDWDAPFLSIPQSDREIVPDFAFGSYIKHSGGIAALPDHTHDRGFVTPYGRDHLLRLHVGP